MHLNCGRKCVGRTCLRGLPGFKPGTLQLWGTSTNHSTTVLPDLFLYIISISAPLETEHSSVANRQLSNVVHINTSYHLILDSDHHIPVAVLLILSSRLPEMPEWKQICVKKSWLLNHFSSLMTIFTTPCRHLWLHSTKKKGEMI